MLVRLDKPQSVILGALESLPDAALAACESFLLESLQAGEDVERILARGLNAKSIRPEGVLDLYLSPEATTAEWEALAKDVVSQWAMADFTVILTFNLANHRHSWIS